MTGLLLNRQLASRPDLGARHDGVHAEVVPLFRDAEDARDGVDGRASGTDEAVVLRRKLFERLAKAGRVTIVSAPAGSGKTWLMRSWFAESRIGRRAVWATVGREDHDGRRFWASVTDAVGAIVDGDAATRVGEVPRSAGDVQVERLLRTLQRIDEPAVLVIDDLHELKSAEALTALERFLADAPAPLRVVLLTRGDPGLGLHRLRLAGALTELRGPDLRFSLPETQALLAASGIVLSEAGTAALHERTEGWAAGLRLAAISLATHPDPERFAVEFCGSERTVAAFLKAEVLDRQPPEVRELLLRTSVLERVDGPLADALTGGSGALRILHELDEADAFVFAVDVGRSCFRYHPMLADLLRQELRRTGPALVGAQHRAAARWFELHGRMIEAIRHAQSAGDWVGAGHALADHQLGLTLDGRGAEVRTLLAAFPPDAPAEDAELALAFATDLVARALYEEAAAHVAMAEGLAATVDAGRRPAFDLALASTTLRLACARGDVGAVPGVLRSLEAALSAQPPSELRRTQTLRATALVDLGKAEIWSLRLDEAQDHLDEALEVARRIERPSIETACLSFLALLGTLRGRPASIGRPQAERAAALAGATGSETHDDAARALAAGAAALVAQGRFAEAEQWLERAEHALAEHGPPVIGLLVRHTWALLRLGQRRIDDALTALGEAERLQARLASPHPFILDLRGRALRAQVQAGQTAAVRAAFAGMGAESRAGAEMRIAAAALELAEGCAEDAVEALRPVIEGSAQALYRESAVIEALLYDAAARAQMGDTREAEASLERALELAEPEGILLPFGLVPVRELLERHRGHRTAHATLLSRILDLLAGCSPEDEAPPLLDPLSDAELRVVRYLPGNLRGPEIAAELCVSPNTIRTHLRHIYAKLGVHTRREAVAHARRLGLLGPA